jgi:hypothetical protein
VAAGNIGDRLYLCSYKSPPILEVDEMTITPGWLIAEVSNEEIREELGGEIDLAQLVSIKLTTKDTWIIKEINDEQIIVQCGGTLDLEEAIILKVAS